MNQKTHPDQATQQDGPVDQPVTRNDSAASGTAQPPPQVSAEEDAAEWKDRFLRATAELENLRKRSSRDLQQQRRFAELPLLQDLLPITDNLQHALDAAKAGPSDRNEMVRGVEIIKDQLLEVMRKHQCESIEAAGKPFDPNFHEAIRQVPTSDHPVGTVLEVVQPGYRLHDRVVRPAKVVVSGAPVSTAPTDSQGSPQETGN